MSGLQILFGSHQFKIIIKGMRSRIVYEQPTALKGFVRAKLIKRAAAEEEAEEEVYPITSLEVLMNKADKSVSGPLRD